MSDNNPSDADPFGAIADEFVEAFRQGQRPSVEEFARRYPEHADAIRDMLPALVMMEKAKSAEDTTGEAGKAAGAAAVPSLRQLGDYQILREVGRGGMGVVYEAQQLSLGRHVAIKVLPVHALLDPRRLSRFQREARSAAKLHHTNIVPVFGVGEQDGLHYYVMQFIQGMGLDVVLAELRRLRHPREKQAPTQGAVGHPTNLSREVSAVDVARGLLTGEFRHPEPADAPTAAEAEPAPPADLGSSPSAATGDTSAIIRLPGQSEGSTLSEAGSRYWHSVARIGMQVADALAHAASQSVLHRDIKPSNLLLDETGNVWVTDFGLAKATSGSDNLTHTGDIVGTLRYMAPERFNGQGDLRSDVYSLGLTLYELLTLRTAFNESDRNKLVKQVMHDEPVPPRKLNPAVPRDLETVVLKAIARDPAHRYQTPAEMADDLKRFLEDRPVQARRISNAERLLRWCRRNPLVASLLAGIVLVFLVGFAGVFWQWREAETARQVAEEKEKEANQQRQIAEEKEKEAKAYGLVQLVLNVDTPKVPPIIEQMAEYRQWTDPMLREVSKKSPQWFHASLALVQVDPGQVDYLYGRLLEADPRDVLPVVRDALAPHKDRLRGKLWAVVEKPEKGKEAQRLRAAAALAKYDPDSKRWAKVQVAVVNDLLAMPAAHLTAWKDLLRPGRAQLLAPLSVVYRSINRPAERSRATDILADYAAGQPHVLADLLMDADDKQFAVIYPKLKEQGERGVPILTSEISKESPTPPVMSDWTVRFHRWERAGNRTVPADWEAVLKSPVLDELRMPRLHLPHTHAPPTPKVPSEYFAVVASAEVTLGDGEYLFRATHDDGVRVWLDNELVIDDWQTVRTNGVTVRTTRGRHIIKVEFFQYIGPYVLDVDLTISEAGREKLAKRQANTAVALLRMDHGGTVWPLFKHSPDPRVRSILIHALSPLGADARALVKQLNRESDVAIRRALLLSLGEFSAKDFTPADRLALLPKLQDIYRTAPDPGLHAAAEWLLRQWKEEAWLKEANQAWADDKQQQSEKLERIEQELKKETGKDEARWYVNGQGQTLVVVPGPVEFWMGSPPAEEGRAGGPMGTEEQRHWRRIGRSFAIASREVTVEQFLRFRKDHPVSRPHAPSDDCPVNNVSWYDAAEYCNWLSEQEGIPNDQWCYELNEEGKYAQGMKPAANYLQRTGYRLPTEAEWEFACRAGAATRFLIGESEELLPRYAWYQKNGHNRSWPVGSLKPNDLGLFDMHGNAWEWCQDRHGPYGAERNGKATEDEGREVIVEVSDSNRFIQRPGFDALDVRSAFRWSQPPSSRLPVVGFRPARTLPFRSFDRYAAARTAALAAAGKGKKQPLLDNAAKAQSRRRALDWLKAELANWSKVQPPRLFIARNLWQWQQDRDLAGIRDQAALAKLPPEEQKACTQFWPDVAKAAEPRNSSERLEFARVAVLIAGKGKDEPRFDNAARAKLRQQALDWLEAELKVTADRAGKARIIATAAPLPGLLEKLAESAPNDGRFQAELARHFAERGDNPQATAARTKARAWFEGRLAEEPDIAALAGELADLLLIDTTCWTVLKPAEMKADGGATLTKLQDNSILVSGPNPPNDVYTLTFRNPPARIRALRLEVLTHESLPRKGPGRADNGNFTLTTIKAQLDPATKPGAARSLKLVNAWADFSQYERDVATAIDANERTGWAVERGGKPHVAVFELAERVAVPDGTVLRVTLEFKADARYQLGRFRLSVSPDPLNIEREQKHISVPTFTDPWLKLAAAYRLEGRNDKAAESYAKALQADPKLGDDRQAQHRYHAARAAALAAAGQGKEAPPLGDAAKAKLRRQALDWLKSELAARTGQPDPSARRVEYVWVDDDIPPGAKSRVERSPRDMGRTETWTWITRPKHPVFSGSRAVMGRPTG